ncbi:hypothetical protein KM043_014632 [Ampulex compressa]|nr:hypothetical protein KM043_014632 [Ampulex compressa]
MRFGSVDDEAANGFVRGSMTGKKRRGLAAGRRSRSSGPGIRRFLRGVALDLIGSESQEGPADSLAFSHSRQPGFTSEPGAGFTSANGQKPPGRRSKEDSGEIGAPLRRSAG